MYDPVMVQPMREELTQLGVQELRTAEDAQEVLGKKEGSVLLIVNSVCGCAAGNARPAVAMAKHHSAQPDKMVTVFAGNDAEATAAAREYIVGYPPSSPAMALFQNGEIVLMLERKDIEGRMAQEIAQDLNIAFDKLGAGSAS
ncbi:MAG: BrxA/BrxB family bacilliredoxin [Candidatus Eisenbacteria bacterium]|uniref:BrxA/BrxB family bacilliredoxin n=1 Tax=Eiseniibacteriota bacterium TaxID=2212470 RepID=A0A7Y2EG29_UNCEI|nr:BrxA/BrxB family bacilliredoxin [Candidatus Eisenbacteria bacterium]